jgi:hypothetical protein
MDSTVGLGIAGILGTTLGTGPGLLCRRAHGTNTPKCSPRARWRRLGLVAAVIGQVKHSYTTMEEVLQGRDEADLGPSMTKSVRELADKPAPPSRP